MALTINTNVSSMIAQNNLNRNVKGLDKAMQQLATGLRINNAGDDAAGLAIAERIKCQVRGSGKAMDNIQDAKNFINVAEGGMISIGDHLQRINELCIQAASDMYDVDGRRALFTEIKQRITEIDCVANGLQFNGQKLLDGSLTAKGPFTIQIGAYADTMGKPINTLDIAPAMTDCNLSKLGAKNGYATIKGITLPSWLDVDSADFGDVTTITEGSAALSQHFGDSIRDYMIGIQDGMNTLTSARGLLGGYTNRMDSTYDNLALTIENLETARSRITDVDIAKASSDMVKYQILQQTTTATLVQANQLPSLALKLIG